MNIVISLKFLKLSNIFYIDMSQGGRESGPQ